MISVTLTMRYGPHPVREAQAWYLASGDPSVWLDEIATWDVPHKDIRLLSVPLSAQQPEPAGALVIVVKKSRPSNPSGRCLPFGQLAHRLYLPVEASLDPDLPDSELKGLLTAGYTYVWHPVAGLVAFEESDLWRITDLLTVGCSGGTAWDRAVAGVAISSKLVSLSPETTMTFEMMLEAGRDDIGTATDDLADLPPCPVEPKPGIMNESARQAKRLLANMIHKLASGLPATGGRPGWIDRLDKWSQEQIAKLTAGMQAARNREIARLLHMLENDPDRGLRFAIPLGGDAHRGLSSPGKRLVEHRTSFSLSGLGGGQAADYWDLSWEYQQQLNERYRDLANREIQLGRHRRAAYIFAELLGDLHAAAGALVDGHHWREAAVLYHKRLQRPLDAARCLEQGCLWAEAVALYEQLKEHERAGDLFVKLDRKEEAQHQFRMAVEDSLTQGNLLSAALLLEDKLDAKDEAIRVLASGWPASTQAAYCLRELLKLYGRLGRHKSAQQRVATLREEDVPPRLEGDLINILIDTATHYPDRSVNDAAADCTRALVSQHLVESPEQPKRHMLQAISRLVPDDRLLNRDCQRFLGERRTVHKPQAPRSWGKPTAPQTVHAFQLPGSHISWQQALVSGSSIFVAGIADNQLLLTRCSWQGPDGEPKSWRVTPYLSTRILLAADPQVEDFVLLHVLDFPLLTTEQTFAASDECLRATKAGAIRGMSASVLGACRTSHGLTWLLEQRNKEFTLVAIGPFGQQIATERVAVPELDETTFGEPSVWKLPVPLHARAGKTYLGLGNRLHIKDRENSHAIEFAGTIQALVGSAPKTRTRIAATFEVGGTVFWDALGGDSHCEAFASEMHSPRTCFSKGGHLIAVGDQRCEVYNTHDQTLQLASEFDFNGIDAIGVLPGPKANQFAVVTATGQITVYQLP